MEGGREGEREREREAECRVELLLTVIGFRGCL